MKIIINTLDLIVVIINIIVKYYRFLDLIIIN